MSKKKSSLRKQNRKLREELAQVKESMDSTSITTSTGFSPSGGWSNPFNKFGLQTDPTFNTIFLPPLEFHYNELTSLYQNPLLRKIIRLHMNDGTRKGLELSGTENVDKAQEIQQEMESRFNWVGLIRKMIGIRHNYGGGVLFVDAEDGRDPKDPLNENRVRKINSFQPVERWFAHPITGRELLGEENPGEPMHYNITLQGFLRSQTFQCHSSRLIRFPTFEADDVLSQKERARRITWDISTIQIVYDTVKRYDIGVQSESQMFQRFVMDVFKVADLRKFKDLEGMRSYIQEQFLLRNSMNAIIMESEGNLEQMSTPVTGLSEMAKDMRMNVSMATDIPLSILFSNESGALGGSTTAEDRKTWNSTVIANQNNQYTPLAREMVRFVSLERDKDWPIDDITYTWPSPYDMSPIEQAEIEFKYSETDSNYVQNLGNSESNTLEARHGSGKWSPATPAFEKDEFDKELEEMEEAEKEEAAQRFQEEMEFKKQAEENANANLEEGTSEDDKEFKLIVEDA